MFCVSYLQRKFPLARITRPPVPTQPLGRHPGETPPTSSSPTAHAPWRSNHTPSPNSRFSPTTSRVPNADPIRKTSVLPKRQLMQSSSRFRQKKVPLDYKPLPLLKGVCVCGPFFTHTTLKTYASKNIFLLAHHTLTLPRTVSHNTHTHSHSHGNRSIIHTHTHTHRCTAGREVWPSPEENRPVLLHIRLC